MMTVRSGPLFGATVAVIVDGPRPDAGFNVTHDPLVVALHEHTACVFTSIDVWPPEAASGSEGEVTSKRQGAAPCVIFVACSATTSDPFLVTGSAFSATR